MDIQLISNKIRKIAKELKHKKKDISKLLKIIEKLENSSDYDQDTPIITNFFAEQPIAETSEVRYENDPHRIGFYENSDFYPFP